LPEGQGGNRKRSIVPIYAALWRRHVGLGIRMSTHLVRDHARLKSLVEQSRPDSLRSLPGQRCFVSVLTYMRTNSLPGALISRAILTCVFESARVYPSELKLSRICGVNSVFTLSGRAVRQDMPTRGNNGRTVGFLSHYPISTHAVDPAWYRWFAASWMIRRHLRRHPASSRIVSHGTTNGLKSGQISWSAR